MSVVLRTTVAGGHTLARRLAASGRALLQHSCSWKCDSNRKHRGARAVADSETSSTCRLSGCTLRQAAMRLLTLHACTAWHATVAPSPCECNTQHRAAPLLRHALRHAAQATASRGRIHAVSLNCLPALQPALAVKETMPTFARYCGSYLLAAASLLAQHRSRSWPVHCTAWLAPAPVGRVLSMLDKARHGRALGTGSRACFRAAVALRQPLCTCSTFEQIHHGSTSAEVAFVRLHSLWPQAPAWL